MFNRRRDLLGKHFLDPFALHRRGQTEQDELPGRARLDFADGRGDEQRGILHHAFTHEGAMPTFGQIAFQGPLAQAHTQLIDEPGHEAFEEGVVGRFLPTGFGVRSSTIERQPGP